MGKDKALVDFQGKQLIQYPIELALQFSGAILISSNSDNLNHLGFPLVRDQYPVQAPLAGIHAGLVKSETPWNLILTCDMPFVSKGLVDFLIGHLPGAGDLLVPFHDGFAEPLCGFYHRNLIPEITENIEKNKLSPLDFIKGYPNRSISVGEIHGESAGRLFKNVNTLSDL
jgi:molybdopterin-guanine dinucleotide biosynthesis protein A